MKGFEFSVNKMTAFLLVLLLLLTACSGTPNSGAASASSEVPDSSEAPVSSEAAAAGTTVSSSGSFSGPVLLTSAGQSADIAMFERILKKTGAAYTSDITAASVGDAKTVVIVVGASTKGLGEAGISTDSELSRSTAFAAAAQQSGVQIVVAHIGGSSRRDALSDQFIDAVLPYANYIIALNGSDEDGKFSGYASSKGIGITKAESLAKLATAIDPLF